MQIADGIEQVKLGKEVTLDRQVITEPFLLVDRGWALQTVWVVSIRFMSCEDQKWTYSLHQGLKQVNRDLLARQILWRVEVIVLKSILGKFEVERSYEGRESLNFVVSVSQAKFVIDILHLDKVVEDLPHHDLVKLRELIERNFFTLIVPLHICQKSPQQPAKLFELRVKCLDLLLADLEGFVLIIGNGPHTHRVNTEAVLAFT